MSTIIEILSSLVGLFIDDEFLAIAVLVVVAAATVLILLLDVEPLLAGAVLLMGNVFVLIASTVRTARRKQFP